MKSGKYMSQMYKRPAPPPYPALCTSAAHKPAVAQPHDCDTCAAPDSTRSTDICIHGEATLGGDGGGGKRRASVA